VKEWRNMIVREIYGARKKQPDVSRSFPCLRSCDLPIAYYMNRIPCLHACTHTPKYVSTLNCIDPPVQLDTFKRAIFVWISPLKMPWRDIGYSTSLSPFKKNMNRRPRLHHNLQPITCSDPAMAHLPVSHDPPGYPYATSHVSQLLPGLPVSY
jgi:hypothetical protein